MSEFSERQAKQVVQGQLAGKIQELQDLQAKYDILLAENKRLEEDLKLERTNFETTLENALMDKEKLYDKYREITNLQSDVELQLQSMEKRTQDLSAYVDSFDAVKPQDLQTLELYLGDIKGSIDLINNAIQTQDIRFKNAMEAILNLKNQLSMDVAMTQIERNAISTAPLDRQVASTSKKGKYDDLG